MQNRESQKEDVMRMDNLQERTKSDAGAAEHSQKGAQSPQEPPVKANEEQVGKTEHQGSLRTSGGETTAPPQEKKNAKSIQSRGRKDKRVA